MENPVAVARFQLQAVRAFKASLAKAQVSMVQ